MPARSLLTLLVLFTLLGGCAVNPVSGERDFVLMTERQEIAAGAQYHQEILKQYKVYDDPELQAYVNRIGQELARQSHRKDLTFHFTVLDSPQVNAFALPGGYIYITRGIMAYLNSEAELAGVLGHEIGHVTARHSVRQQSSSQVTGLLGGLLNVATGQDPAQGLFSQLSFALSQGYGRKHELEADRLGAEYLARIGYAPGNMIDVISVLKNQELFAKQKAQREGREVRGYHGLFSSHPKNDKRLREVIQAANRFRSGQDRDIGRQRYLQHIDGMPFGQSAADGIVRDNHFYHAGLNAELTAPAGWEIENLPDRLLFIAPGQSAFVQTELLPRPAGQSAEQVLLTHLKRQRLQSGQRLARNNMSGYSGVATVDKTPYGRRPVQFSLWLRGEHAWLFAAMAKQQADFNALQPVFSQVVNSLDGLNQRERALARSLQLDIAPVRSGDRYADWVAGSPLGDLGESQLRLLNGDYPQGELSQRKWIKVVR